MTQKLEITNIETTENKTVVSYHRFDQEGDSITDKLRGTWEFEGNLTSDEVVEKAKTLVDVGIEVFLNATQSENT